jgi:hypothetical protein
MQPIGKMLLGVILVLASIYYIAYGLPMLNLKPAWPDLLTLLNGAIPLLVLLIGVFIVWLEWDEWKIEKELAKEEREVARRPRRGRRKR